MQCPIGHMMNFVNDSYGYPNGYYCCSQCSNNFPCSMGRYACPQCGYIRCQNCKPIQTATVSMPGFQMNVSMPGAPIYPSPSPSPYGGSKVCSYGHPLQYTTSDFGCSFGCFKCSKCQANAIACTLGRWVCNICNASICNKCVGVPDAPPMPSPNPYPYNYPNPMPAPNPYPAPMPNPSPMPYPSPQPSGTLYCKKGHLMTHSTSAAGSWDGMFTCAFCLQKKACSFGRLSCTHCGYDVCYNCKPY